MDVLKEFEHEIAGVTLVPSSGGRFEVRLDDQLIFSKAALGRHARPGEVVELVRQVLAPEG